jgi:hypothetical protein
MFAFITFIDIMLASAIIYGTVQFHNGLHGRRALRAMNQNMVMRVMSRSNDFFSPLVLIAGGLLAVALVVMGLQLSSLAMIGGTIAVLVMCHRVARSHNQSLTH